jgi:quinol monooxygenase YgiN
MAYEGPTVSVHVKITIDPSKTDAFLEAFRPTFDGVAAEPLNTFFELYRDERHPGVFKLVENWNATPDYMMQVGTLRSDIGVYLSV